MIFKFLITGNIFGIWSKSNDFKPSYFYQTSIKRFSNEQLNIEYTDNLKEELQNKTFYKFDY